MICNKSYRVGFVEVDFFQNNFNMVSKLVKSGPFHLNLSMKKLKWFFYHAISINYSMFFFNGYSKSIGAAIKMVHLSFTSDSKITISNKLC